MNTEASVTIQRVFRLQNFSIDVKRVPPDTLKSTVAATLKEHTIGGNSSIDLFLSYKDYNFSPLMAVPGAGPSIIDPVFQVTFESIKVPGSMDTGSRGYVDVDRCDKELILGIQKHQGIDDFAEPFDPNPKGKSVNSKDLKAVEVPRFYCLQLAFPWKRADGFFLNVTLFLSKKEHGQVKALDKTVGFKTIFSLL